MKKKAALTIAMSSSRRLACLNDVKNSSRFVNGTLSVTRTWCDAMTLRRYPVKNVALKGIVDLATIPLSPISATSSSHPAAMKI